MDGLGRTIRKRLASQGWRIERLASGRYRYWPPRGGDPVVASEASSDWRAVHHVLAMLRRRGFVFEHEAPLRATRRMIGTTRVNGPSDALERDVPNQEVEMPMDSSSTVKTDKARDAANGAATQKATFHGELRRLRLESKMQRAEVAELLGIAESTYSLWEIGSINPGLASYLRLCELYPSLREAELPRQRVRKKTPKATPPRAHDDREEERSEAELLRAGMQFVLRARVAPWRAEVVRFLGAAHGARLSLQDVLRLFE